MGKKNKKSKSVAAPTAATSRATAIDIERKLRPIYEALDSRNYKLSLKLLNAALSKHGDVATFLALKALALERSGKIGTATAVAKQAQSMESTDLAALSALAMTFKAMHMHGETVKCYSLAVAKNPKEERLLLGLFNSLLWTTDYVEMQKVTMRLYSLVKDEKYLFWSAVTMLVQSTGGPLLKLAVMMVQRAYPDPQVSLPHSEDVLVLARLFMEQGEHRKALELFEAPQGEAFRKNHLEFLRMKASLLAKLEEWDAVAATYLSMLVGSNGNVDDWWVLQHWVQAQLRRAQESPDNAKAIELETRRLVNEWQVSEGTSSRARRGVFLAELELEAKLKPNGFEGPRDQLCACLLAVFERFASKMCFFLDVQDYLLLLSKEELRSLCQRARKAVYTQHAADLKNSHLSRPRCTKLHVLRITTLRQLLRFAARTANTTITHTGENGGVGGNTSGNEGGGDEVEEADVEKRSVANVVEILKEFMMGYKVDVGAPEEGDEEAIRKEAKTDIRERGCADVLLLLGCMGLFDLFRATGKLTYIMDAITLLEWAVRGTMQYNFQAKILLARLYCHHGVGGFARAFQLYRSLEFKHIQLDTLTHLLLSDAMRFGFNHLGIDICEQVAYFHKQQAKSAPDMTRLAFQHNSYAQVQEFAELRSRLEHSHQLAVSKVEHVHARAACEPNTFEGLDDLIRPCTRQSSEAFDGEMKRMVCNSDHKVLLCWDRSAELQSLLCRPSDSVALSSYALPSPHYVKRKAGSKTWELAPFQKAFLRLRRASLLMLQHTLHRNPSELRRALGLFKADLKLLALTGGTTPCAFGADMWGLVEIVFAVSASVIEANMGLIGGLPVGEVFKLWDGVEHQMQLAQECVARLSSCLCALTVQQMSEEGQPVTLVSAEAVPQLAIFASHAGQWVPICLQVCSALVPTPGPLKKIRVDDHEAFVDRCAEVRGSVRAAADAVRSALTAMIAATKKASPGTLTATELRSKSPFEGMTGGALYYPRETIEGLTLPVLPEKAQERAAATATRMLHARQSVLPMLLEEEGMLSAMESAYTEAQSSLHLSLQCCRHTLANGLNTLKRFKVPKSHS